MKISTDMPLVVPYDFKRDSWELTCDTCKKIQEASSDSRFEGHAVFEFEVGAEVPLFHVENQLENESNHGPHLYECYDENDEFLGKVQEPLIEQQEVKE